MENASPIKHITIAVPTTMTEQQAGLMTSAIAYFMKRNPQAVVALCWSRTNKHAVARSPRVFSPIMQIDFSDTAEAMGQVAGANQSIKDLGNHMTGQTAIPATTTDKQVPEEAQAHKSAFALVSTFRKTQVSSVLGYV